MQLAKEAGINYRAIYKNTTIDPPGNLKHVKDNNVEILNPKKSFMILVEENGFPNMFKRFCCRHLKEYKVLDKCIMGVRKSESVKRTKRYTEPTECKFYGSKKNHVEAIYPILDWTDGDVLEFIKDRNIKLHDLYYDKNGNIDISQRLGCMCCPLQSYKKRIASFKKYPNMVKLYLRHGKVYFDNHPEGTPARTYNDVYEWFVRDLFYNKQSKWEEDKNSLFKDIDYKKFLEDYFNIKL